MLNQIRITCTTTISLTRYRMLLDIPRRSWSCKIGFTLIPNMGGSLCRDTSNTTMIAPESRMVCLSQTITRDGQRSTNLATRCLSTRCTSSRNAASRMITMCTTSDPQSHSCQISASRNVLKGIDLCVVTKQTIKSHQIGILEDTVTNLKRASQFTHP